MPPSSVSAAVPAASVSAPPAPQAVPVFGPGILARADLLARWSDDADGLTCAYLTPAHRRTAAQLAQWMEEAGMQVHIDMLGNVVGRYAGSDPHAGVLLTGSHYDTVRNGGKYDGRFGILLPVAVVAHLHARGERLPFELEVIAFAEEEGVRFKSTFLGSSAIIGRFDLAGLDATDTDGVSLRAALIDAGAAAATLEADIAALARDPARLLGFVEVHIEQGPVLLARGLPVGVVSAIAGSVRLLVRLRGTAAHAGTTPMHMRQDAAAAAAQIILAVEARCSRDQQHGLVGTVGQLRVPGGSVNVIPGACELSLDIRAADDAVRDAAVADLLQQIEAICAGRGVTADVDEILRAPAAPCAAALMAQVAAAVARCGVSPLHLPSGAGHDAMQMASVTPAAMLFTRCGNGGISHNPRETLDAADADLSALVFLDFLRHYAAPVASGGT